MATVYLTNHLYPDNPQLIVIDVQKIVKLTGEANTSFHRNRSGEQFWEIVIYTSGVDSSGSALGPYWVDVIGTEETLNELISSKISEIGQDIDWSLSSKIDDVFLEQEDRYGPIVYWTYPSDGQVDVPIGSSIVVRLRDLLPAKGIDISTLVFKVNGFELNPEVSGNKYDYVLTYKPNIG